MASERGARATDHPQHNARGEVGVQWRLWLQAMRFVGPANAGNWQCWQPRSFSAARHGGVWYEPILVHPGGGSGSTDPEA